RDLVYDPVGDRIYASVPSSPTFPANLIVRINPGTGDIEASVAVDGDPGKLAVSTNGQYLYVAVANGTAVQRITVATLRAEPPFLLGKDPIFSDPLKVDDMAVVPDRPEAIAVSRMNLNINPRHVGVAIYDDGVPRPKVTSRQLGINAIEFGSTN